MLKELWVDDPSKLVLNPKYLDGVKDLGFSGISIMANHAVRPYKITWQIDKVEKLVKECIKRDVEVSTTLWIPPSEKRIIEFSKNYIKPLYETGIAAVEFDLEHLWKTKRVVGYGNLHQAARDLVWRLEEEREVYHDVRVDVTTHMWHGEAKEGGSFTKFADRLYLQAYGINKDLKNNPVSWDNGPGKTQERALRRLAWLPSHVKLCLGLPAWGQTWKQHTPEEAMYKAYSVALHKTVPIVRYWSSKFIIGVRKNKYAYNFFKKLNENECKYTNKESILLLQ